jgi:uncharacterized protein with HEPN domain
MTLNGIVLHKFELIGKNTRELRGLLPLSVKDLQNDFFLIRFRNFVVHRYENVRDEIILDILRNHLDDLGRFINEVESNA